jgi:hypothetical protein
MITSALADPGAEQRPPAGALLRDHAQHLLNEIPEDLDEIADRLTALVNGHEQHNLPADQWLSQGHREILKAISAQAESIASVARLVLSQIIAAAP